MRFSRAEGICSRSLSWQVGLWDLNPDLHNCKALLLPGQKPDSLHTSKTPQNSQFCPQPPRMRAVTIPHPSWGVLKSPLVRKFLQEDLPGCKSKFPFLTTGLETNSGDHVWEGLICGPSLNLFSQGLSRQSSDEDSALQSRGHGFDLWSGD